MYSHTAYGLGIHSFLPLPELAAGNGKADVIFGLGKVDETSLRALDGARSFKATSDEACYFFKGVGKFLVRGGREVIVDPNPGADERAVRLCLLGPIVALVLHQQGRLILHASAVALGDDAIAFLGGQGWGKSTLAAAFHVRGYRVLADDVTAIQTDSAVPMALPGFPQIKLWPNSIVALGADPEILPAVHPDFNKRAFRVTKGFAEAPLPLKRIYALAAGPDVHIESLSPQEALIELISHSYAARFGNELLQASGLAMHFKQCVRVAQNTSLCRFTRTASLSSLDEHVNILIKDFCCEG
jgi:hypothetical protein